MKMQLSADEKFIVATVNHNPATLIDANTGEVVAKYGEVGEVLIITIL
jgi:hypothetical protein